MRGPQFHEAGGAEPEGIVVVKRRGGWFATGESWPGPWRTQEAAALAALGEYEAAHEMDRKP
jgi:hypothetical protein